MSMVLHDEGEYLLLDVVFRGASLPANWYVGIYKTANPGETDTVALLTEVSGGSYARVALALNGTDWPTLALASGDEQVESKTITFASPSADWATAASAFGLFLTTTSSGTGGKLVASFPFASALTILNGDPAPSFKVRIKLS